MIAAGFGFRREATAASLRDALARAAGDRRVAVLAAPEDKAAAPPLRTLAAALGLPVVPVTEADLRAAETLSSSAASVAARGTGSVAEAAAMVGAGAGAHLVAPRAVSEDRHATCAIAEGWTE